MPSLPAETPRTTHPITRLLPREGECLHTGYRHAELDELRASWPRIAARPLLGGSESGRRRRRGGGCATAL